MKDRWRQAGIGLLVAIFCPAVGASGNALGAASDSPPNVLFVVADDLGWSDVGWHGGFAHTPHMDRLVATGVELDRHYVQPVCTPTRTALMTGRYPGRFGPQAIKPSNLRAFQPGTPTLAAALRSLGYRTSQSGKWHLGSMPEWGPLAHGFDHGYGTLTGAADPWTHKYRRGPYEETWHRDGRPVREEGNATELVAAEAVRRIREGAVSGRPWFVYVPFHAVHTPVDAPERYKRLYEGVTFHEDHERDDSRRRLAAMVSQLDAKLGEMVSAIDESGERDETLIIFTSDNGGIESLRNAYVGDVSDSPLNSDNRPLRGQKNSLYEGGVRVCAFANWPGTLEPRRCQSPMHVADWFPTLAGLVGYHPPADAAWDGVDRWRAVLGPEDLPRGKPIVIVHQSGRAVIDGALKLILRHRGKPELFDLSDDPFESRDLADERTEDVERLQAIARADKALDLVQLPDDLRGLPP